MMNRNVISVKKDYQTVIETIVRVLKNNGVVIMPSDTVYGFLFVENSIERVKKIKGRENNPFLFLADTIERVEEAGGICQPYLAILQRHWPGPFTFVLDRKEGGTCAVRIPEWEVLQKIISKTGEVLYSTSVNYAGEKPFDDPRIIVKEFYEQVDLIVIDPDFIPGVPSTLVRLSREEGIFIRRQGGKEFQL